MVTYHKKWLIRWNLQQDAPDDEAKDDGIETVTISHLGFRYEVVALLQHVEIEN